MRTPFYSSFQVYLMPAQLSTGWPFSVPGLNRHLARPWRAASSKRLKPEDLSTADSLTLPSVPTKNFKLTVPSSSKRRDALGYSGFSQLAAAITAAVRTSGAGGAVTTGAGAGEGGVSGCGLLVTAAMALTGGGVFTGTTTGGT